MYLISIEKCFEAAHFIRGYSGKCERLHGHRYKVVARLKVSKLNKDGIAYDFRLLKEHMSGILKKYDHICLNDVEPFVKINPTAENIASTIYGELKLLLHDKASIDSIEVWESPESCATFKPD